jgi:hypothetical protein
MRFADSGRRTHAMNLEGVRWGPIPSDGVVVPDSEGYAERPFASNNAANTPDSIAIPRVPIAS